MVDKLLKAIEEINIDDLEIRLFKSELKAHLLLINSLEDDFSKKQKKLENLIHKELDTAKRFFNILKAHYLQKLLIYKTGSNEDFKIFSYVKAFENRFLNISK
jgi:hypothetical protein